MFRAILQKVVGIPFWPNSRSAPESTAILFDFTSVAMNEPKGQDNVRQEEKLRI